MARMFRLDEFRYDAQIGATDVSVDVDGSLERMPRDQAIELAHRQGANLVAELPGDDDCPSCVISPVAEPPRWERAPFDPAVESVIDENLWFTGLCGGRDYLLPENGHTFNGRMSAWCPDKRVGYNVSLGEIDDRSIEATYFIKGFLAGDGPAPPYDEEGDVDAADLHAWHAAIQRFNNSGSWFGRWRTCIQCGCVLLPDSFGDRCADHPAGEAGLSRA